MRKEILNKFQEQVLKAIGQSKLSQSYIWGGGTALAYQIKHRISKDLDFFSLDLYPDEFILSEINKIKQDLAISSIKELKKQNRFLFTLTKDNQEIKLEFIYFPFKHLAKPQFCKEFDLKINSILDTAVNKLFALYERAEPKDIFDLYFLIKREQYSLDFLIKKITKKFGVEIDKTNLCRQSRSALENLESLHPFLMKKVSLRSMRQEMNKLFQTSAEKYLKNMLIF